MQLIGVFGIGGFGREVMPLVQADGCEAVFVDDAADGSSINGARSMTFAGFCDEPAAARAIVLAIGSSTVRETLAARCAAAGIGFAEVRAANVVAMDGVSIGEGAILSPFVTLTSNIRIGRHFHANLYSYVAHDCVIGDFVTFAPKVCCNGNVVIEDHAYIGTGAVLKQGTPARPLRIGRGAVVGMGAVVTKDVPPGVTVVGNPARPLER
jgi:sugar O-acyltransferase (sialic acid O-acetyltransferase NeuD family)